MSNWDKAFIEIIGIEGGYVNDPDDPGGETKYGISKRAFPDEDIKNLTLERAKFLYYTHYWAPLDLDMIRHRTIAMEIFDVAVNMGRSIARRFAVEALSLLKNFDYLTYDGVTVSALVSLTPKEALIFCKIYNGLQFCRYKEIVEKNPVMMKYFKGWMKRV